MTHQRMLAEHLMQGEDREALFDFCMVAAEKPELIANLKGILVGKALFASLIRERFQMEVEHVSGIEAFSVWYESLPRQP
jgi:hypothetical protein